METIEDIVREMRGQGGDSGYPLDIKRYADRIDAMASATARQIEEMAAENTNLTDMYDKLDKDFGELYKEYLRLKAALKPVLDVKWELYKGSYCSGTVPCESCERAVREAQRIYNEGAK